MLMSDRVILGSVSLEDLNDNYVGWLNDPLVNQFLETRFSPQSLKSVRAYWDAHHDDPNSPWFALRLRSDGRHIGNIKLGPINWIHRRADISLFIGERSCWGGGYATEVISCLSDWAFNELNLHKLTAGAYAENIGSIRAFEKSGFQIEGIFREEVVSAGNRADVVRLALLRGAK